MKSPYKQGPQIRLCRSAGAVPCKGRGRYTQ